MDVPLLKLYLFKYIYLLFAKFAFPIFVSYSELGIDLEREREKKGHHIRLRENDDLPLW